MATLKYRDENGEWQVLEYSRMPKWSQISGKPTEFTPAQHTHEQADIDNLPYELSAKVDKFIAPFASVTYKGENYTKWKFSEGSGISLLLDVNGSDLSVARFSKTTGKFMLSLPSVLFDGEEGVANTKPVIKISGMVDGVKHSDFSDITSDLSPEKSSIADIMTKLNSVIDRLKGSALALVLSCSFISYSAPVDVQRAKLSMIFVGDPSKTYVVTNVTGAASTSDLAAKQPKLPYPTNAIPYTVISGKPDISDMATKTWVIGKNYVTKAVTNGLSTIAYVDDHTPGNYENVSNKAMTAIQEHQDISGKQDKLIAGENITISSDNVISTVKSEERWILTPDRSEDIPDNAYRSACALAEIISPTNIQIGVGSKTFAYLPKLKTVIFGKTSNSTKPIASDAFHGLHLDTLIISNKSNEVFTWPGDFGFAGATFVKGYFPVTELPTSLSLGTYTCDIGLPCVKQVPEGYFSENVTITNVESLASAHTIGKNAFSGCSNLRTVHNSKKCRYYGDYAFDGCIKLSNIGDAIHCTYVGSCTFQDCTELKRVCLGVVTNLGFRAFRNAGASYDIEILVSNGGYSFTDKFMDNSGEIASISHNGKIYCSNAFLINNDGTWEIKNYLSTEELPHPGNSECIYTVGSSKYIWNGSDYETTTLSGSAYVNEDGSLEITADETISGGVVTIRYEDKNREQIPGWLSVDSSNW